MTWNRLKPPPYVWRKALELLNEGMPAHRAVNEAVYQLWSAGLSPADEGMLYLNAAPDAYALMLLRKALGIQPGEVIDDLAAKAILEQWVIHGI